MKKLKVYIAGSVKGRPIEEAIQHFKQAETYLSQHYEITNPVTVIQEENRWRERKHLPPLTDQDHRDIIMMHCIAKLVICDAIYLLIGWEDSAGAVIEKKVAEAMGKIIMYEKNELPCQNH